MTAPPVVFLSVFLDIFAVAIVVPLLPYLSRSEGGGAFQFGWQLASFGLGQLVFLLLWKALAERLGRRQMFLLLALGSAVAAAGTALAPSFAFALLARFFAGGFCATAFFAGPVQAGAAFALALVIGPLVGGQLAAFGFREAILAAAAVHLAGFVLVAMFYRETTAVPALPDFSIRSRFGAAWARGRRLESASFYLYVAAFTQLDVSFGLFLLDRFQVPVGQAGVLLGLLGLATALAVWFLPASARAGKEAVAGLLGLLVLGLSLAAAATAPGVIVFGGALLLAVVAKGWLAPQFAARGGGVPARVLAAPVAGLLFVKLGPESPLWAAAALVAVAFAAAFLRGLPIFSRR